MIQLYEKSKELEMNRVSMRTYARLGWMLDGVYQPKKLYLVDTDEIYEIPVEYKGEQVTCKPIAVGHENVVGAPDNSITWVLAVAGETRTTVSRVIVKHPGFIGFQTGRPWYIVSGKEAPNWVKEWIKENDEELSEVYKTAVRRLP